MTSFQPPTLARGNRDLRYREAYQALLAKWPVPCESLTIATSFGATHVLASGTAHSPPLLLLHGLRATALVWRPNVAALSQHFRVLAVDIVGQGGLSLATRPLRNRQDYARWLEELCDGLGVERASLVGNSFGAFLAMSQASLTPARVRRVALINPAGVFVSLLPYVPGICWRLTSYVARNRKPPELALLLGNDVKLRPDEAEWAGLVSMTAWRDKLRADIIFPRVFSATELQAIQAPTLLLMGDNDLLCNAQETVRRARQRMPALQTRLLPGAHHIAAMARPEEANEQIINFLLATE